MLPSLKSTYDSKLKLTLEEIKRNPEILREVIDQKMIDEIERGLGKLGEILKMPELASLDSFHLGLQKAHDELSSVLAYGDLRSWAHTLLPKGFTALGRLAAFTTGLTKLLRQLPQLVNIVKGSMDSERQNAWDANKPMDQLMDSKTTAKLLKLVVKAMEPAKSLLSLSTGLPYVKDAEAASEILGLSFNQLIAFSKASQAVKAPIALSQAKELGQGIEKVTDQGQPAEQEGQPSTPPAAAQAEKERLVIPAPSGTATKSAPIAQSSPPVKQQPTTRAAESDLSDVYDETLFSMLGEQGINNKNFAKFKGRFINNMLKLMLQKNYVKREPKPQS